jgi:hypothetical protein
MQTVHFKPKYIHYKVKLVYLHRLKNPFREIQDGRQLRKAETLSSTISEKYFRVVIAKLG